MRREPVVTVGAQTLLTALLLWGLFAATNGLVTVWTETLIVASVVVPIWLAVGRSLDALRVGVREVRRSRHEHR